MIEPTEHDIGRAVVYTGNRYPGGKLEEGVITSFNDYAVFVRYGADKGRKHAARRSGMGGEAFKGALDAFFLHRPQDSRHPSRHQL
jgi:hypothetical protein